MDIYKDLIDGEPKYDLNNINEIMRNIQKGTICDISNVEKVDKEFINKMEEFRNSEEWNELIKENFNCDWMELKTILFYNFAIGFNFIQGFFFIVWDCQNYFDKFGFRNHDIYKLRKVKINIIDADMEAYCDDKFRFGVKKTTYDKNISFRISEEACNNLKEIMNNSKINNGALMSKLILEGYEKYYLRKKEIPIIDVLKEQVEKVFKIPIIQ